MRGLRARAGARGARRRGRASAAAAVPGQLLGRRAAGDADPRTAPAAEAGRSRQHADPHRLGRGAADRGGPFDWSAVDSLRRTAPPRRASKCCRSSTGAPRWAVPTRYRPRDGSPKTLPVSTGRPAPGWTAFAARAVQRYGPNGSFWAENPAVPKRPIRTWQIWNEENFKYFVAQPESGRIRQAGQALLRGDQQRRPGRAADPRRPLRPADRRHLSRKPPQAYFAADFLEQMYASDAGDQVHVPGGRPASLHRQLQAADPVHRRIPRRAEGEPRRRQGALADRARLELASPPANEQLLRQGPRRPGGAAEGRLPPARASSASGTSSASTGSRSTTSRAPATSATAPACSAKASSRSPPGAPTSASPAASRLRHPAQSSSTDRRKIGGLATDP